PIAGGGPRRRPVRGRSGHPHPALTGLAHPACASVAHSHDGETGARHRTETLVMSQAAAGTVVGALAFAACVGVVSPARAVTGQQLLRQCEALERGAVRSGGTVRLPKSQEAAACWFYM